MLLSLAYNSHGMGEFYDYVRSLGVLPLKQCASLGPSTQILGTSAC